MDPTPTIAPKAWRASAPKGGGAEGSVMQPRNPQRQAPTSRNLNKRSFLAAERLFLATLKSLYDDREILEKVPVITLGKEAINSARSRPLSQYYSDMYPKMAEQPNASLKDTKPPEEAIRTLDRELQEIVDLGETS